MMRGGNMEPSEQTVTYPSNELAVDGGFGLCTDDLLHRINNRL